MFRSLQLTISAALLALLSWAALADGIGGGGSGVHGIGPILPGRLGVGAAPASWGAARKSIDIGSGAIYGDTTNYGLFWNHYINAAGTATYKADGYASRILLTSNGLIAFLTAPSGLAGGTPSLANVLQINNDGTTQANAACYSGFSRGVVGQCTNTPDKAVTALPPGASHVTGACTEITPGAAYIAAMQRYVRVVLDVRVLTDGTTGVKSTDVGLYDTSGCTNALAFSHNTAHDWGGTVSGDVITGNVQHLTAYTGGRVWAKSVGVGGPDGGQQVYYKVVEYGD